MLPLPTVTCIEWRAVKALGKTCVWASIGKVWPRHLAPAAPASRPSLPTQFYNCACHADGATQFLSLPSELNGARVGLHLQGSGLCCLFGLSSGRSVRMRPILVSAGALVCLLLLTPLGHIPVYQVLQVMGGGGGHRSPSWATATSPGIFRSLGFRNRNGYWLVQRSTYSHTRGGKGSVGAPRVCVQSQPTIFP